MWNFFHVSFNEIRAFEAILLFLLYSTAKYKTENIFLFIFYFAGKGMKSSARFYASLKTITLDK